MYSSELLEPPSHRLHAIKKFLPFLASSEAEVETMSERDVLQLPITTLAYIGDAWYELQLRQSLLKGHQGPSGELNQASAFFSSALFQAYLYMSFDMACEGVEANLLRRARNHKTRSVPKHGDIQAYRLATAVEAILGYWLLCGQEARARVLLYQAWQDASEAWCDEEQVFSKREVSDDK